MTVILRRDVKTAVAELIGTVAGVKRSYTFRQKQQSQNDMPSVVVTIPKQRETRISASAPNGKKRIDFTVQLEVFTFDVSPDGSDSLIFDDLLDAMDASLRLDVTLGGAVHASTVEHITTSVMPPTMVNGQAVALMALKTFDVTVHTTG
jgi:hypothetical protein